MPSMSNNGPKINITKSGGGGGVGSYTNTDPSVITVGGIPAGTTFNNKSFPDMMNMMLYPELYPLLTNPSISFLLTQSGLREVGEVVAALNFNSTFSRGSISPAYGTSGFRSGLPNQYNYTGAGLTTTVSSTSLSDAQVVSTYTVLLGSQSWTSSTTYDIGEQPLSSEGTNYNSPLVAGTTSPSTVDITGVYPTFATTSSIVTLTKQTLASMSSVYIQTNMVAETIANKQTIDIPTVWSTITGVQFFNTINNSWEFISGSKANSLLTFTVTDVTNTVQGNSINYKRYTNNTSTRGALQLRWYTT